MKYAKMTASVLFLFSGFAWSDEPSRQIKTTDEVIAVTKGGNMFATDLYHQLSSKNQNNLFFSPYSISTALAMTFAGAEGQTRSQMADVLHFPKQESELYSAYGALTKTLISKDETTDFQLRVANRLWGQTGFHFLPKFLQVTKTDFDADLGLLDFKQSEISRKAINSWIEEQTDNKITDLIAPGVLDANTRLVLTNAIFFKARWKQEFNDRLTTDAPFHISTSLKNDVPTMQQTSHFRYAALNDLQLLELPYGQTGSLSMLILLPKKTDGLSGLEKQLNVPNLEKWSSGLKSTNVEVHLPKFKMTSEFSLNDVLKSMGMSLAFSVNEADFSRMSTQEQLFISAVIHKAFVDVHEEGTEAAAATAVAIATRAMPAKPQEPVMFRADHPFIFLIRHNPTNCVLFLGRIVNPKG